MKKFYIFLDIDGVLDNEDYWWECYNRHHVEGIMSCNFWPLAPNCLLNLMKLYQYLQKKKYDPKIVLSSSWRLSKSGILIVKCRLAEYGMLLYDVTPDINGIRGEEIVDWLDTNGTYQENKFIVLDDEIRDIREYINKVHIVQTTMKEGFNDKCLEQAKQKIRSMIK